MREIFISYRRDDSQDATGRIHDWLDHYFGSAAVFRDIDSIRGGSHFPTTLAQTLTDCKLVLAIIGPSWLTAVPAESGEQTRRMTSDWVRIELFRAREQGKRVIPVLVTHAQMPRASDLPEELRYLCELNAVVVEPGIHFRSGMNELVREISRLASLHADDYPSAFGNCRDLGMVSACMGLFSTSSGTVAAVESARDLLIIMNDGRGFLDSMQEKVRERTLDANKSTRVVLLHPKSLYLKLLIEKNGKELSDQIGDIRRSFNTLQRSSSASKAIVVRGTYAALPSSYMITERHAFMSPYLSTERGALPIFQFVHSSDSRLAIYRTLAQDAESIFDRSQALSRSDFLSDDEQGASATHE